VLSLHIECAKRLVAELLRNPRVLVSRLPLGFLPRATRATRDAPVRCHHQACSTAVLTRGSRRSRLNDTHGDFSPSKDLPLCRDWHPCCKGTPRPARAMPPSARKTLACHRQPGTPQPHAPAASRSSSIHSPPWLASRGHTDRRLAAE